MSPLLKYALYGGAAYLVYKLFLAPSTANPQPGAGITTGPPLVFDATRASIPAGATLVLPQPVQQSGGQPSSPPSWCNLVPVGQMGMYPQCLSGFGAL